MVAHADVTATAWDGDQFVRVARSVTDVYYVCFLSDLAVDAAYKGRGIGRGLQHRTQHRLGPHCKIVLLAAPDGDTYYERIGLSRHPRCWILSPGEQISD